MNLDSVISSVVYKKLVQVDLPGGSNQHEINGVRELRQFFNSTDQISGNITWLFFSDESDPEQSIENFTFYDARAKSSRRTGRSEWRLYYSGNFINRATPGDILFLVKTVDTNIYGLIIRENSGWLRAAKGLFKINEIPVTLRLLPENTLYEQNLEFTQQQILNELGIDFVKPTPGYIDDLAAAHVNVNRNHQKGFPSTSIMSSLAHKHVEVDMSNADETLVTWLDFEESLFRAMEKIIVQEKLDQGFDSVDEFVKYSLSVQNRRKSRMGYALQNHLDYLFSNRGLKFETQKTTEGKNTPDFLFPGQNEYLDNNFNSNLLVMLAAKSSTKERWRQILTEANRIEIKHLCTLAQSLSKDQINEMNEHKVQLVLPSQLHIFYTQEQKIHLWTLEQFINFVQSKQ